MREKSSIHSLGHTSLLVLSKSINAAPLVTGIVDVSVCRDAQCHTSRVLLPKSALAQPGGPVAVEIAVRWNGDGDTTFALLDETPLALPDIARRGQVSIGRDVYFRTVFPKNVKPTPTLPLPTVVRVGEIDAVHIDHAEIARAEPMKAIDIALRVVDQLPASHDRIRDRGRGMARFQIGGVLDRLVVDHEGDSGEARDRRSHGQERERELSEDGPGPEAVNPQYGSATHDRLE